MSPEQITSLGEAAAKAAQRAIKRADQAGLDQNRGQFVRMVALAIEGIPPELRGEYAKDFLENEAKHPYGQIKRQVSEMAAEKEDFAAQVRRLGYPSQECPPAFRRQWLEGEQASFDDNPDACHYPIGSAAAYWWQQGFDAAEAVSAALDEDPGANALCC